MKKLIMFFVLLSTFDAIAMQLFSQQLRTALRTSQFRMNMINKRKMSSWDQEKADLTYYIQLTTKSLENTIQFLRDAETRRIEQYKIALDKQKIFEMRRLTTKLAKRNELDKKKYRKKIN